MEGRWSRDGKRNLLVGSGGVGMAPPADSGRAVGPPGCLPTVDQHFFLSTPLAAFSCLSSCSLESLFLFFNLFF